MRSCTRSFADTRSITRASPSTTSLATRSRSGGRGTSASQDPRLRRTERTSKRSENRFRRVRTNGGRAAEHGVGDSQDPSVCAAAEARPRPRATCAPGTPSRDRPGQIPRGHPGRGQGFQGDGSKTAPESLAARRGAAPSAVPSLLPPWRSRPEPYPRFLWSPAPPGRRRDAVCAARTAPPRSSAPAVPRADHRIGGPHLLHPGHADRCGRGRENARSCTINETVFSD